MREVDDVYRSLVEAAEDPMLVCDGDGRYLYVNGACAAVLGRPRDEIPGSAIADFFPPDIAAEFLHRIRRVIESGTAVHSEDRLDINGGTRWYNTILQPLADSSGRVVAAQAIVRDITAQRRADRALLESARRLRQAVHVSNIGIFEHDHLRRNEYLSPEARDIYGIGEDTVMLVGPPDPAQPEAVALYDCLHVDDRERVLAAIARTHDPAGDGVYELERRHICPDGTLRWVSIRAQTFFEGEGASRRSVRTVGAVQDITALKAAEAAQRAGDERLRQAVDVAQIGFFEHDHRTNRLYMSAEQRRINGLDPDVELVLGRPVEPGEKAVTFDLLIHPDDVDTVTAAVRRSHDPAGDGSYDVEHRFIAPDGRMHWVRTRAQTFFEGEGAARRPVRTVGASRDITADKQAEAERLALQAQLNEAQKMESVGRLAGGVAHDFNNMLNVILGWSGITLAELAPGDPMHQALSEIQTAAERAASLTRQLLAFARRQPMAPKVINLNDRIDRSLTVLRRMLGEDVALSWHPGEALWPVRIDPAQLDQILANLAANARDAIQDVGRVTISTGNLTIGDAPGAARANPAPGDYVLFRFADTGRGMDEDTQAHSFEPFFSTKGQGKGTGLGLATVYGIVRQNEGAIRLDSLVGEGTTVSIYLPRFAGAGVVDREETGEAAPRDRGVVLLVEDEPMMLELSRAMLERIGYRVIAAATPEAAITLADRHAGAIDLLFTDIVMPTMNGFDLAAHLVTKYEHLRCLFASGHFAPDLAGSGDLEGIHFLQKPFTINDLAAKIRAALGDEE